MSIDKRGEVRDEDQRLRLMSRYCSFVDIQKYVHGMDNSYFD